MNVFLMHRDRDFDENEGLPWNAEVLEQDLGMNALVAAMAGKDDFLLQVSRKALLLSLHDVPAIRYRQGILADCIQNPQVLRELYGLTIEAMKRKRESWFLGYSRYYPSSILYGAVELLHSFLDLLRRLRLIAEQHAAKFRSEGFRSLFATFREELSEEYLDLVLGQLRELRLHKGALLSARLGSGNKGIDYMLRRPNRKQPWLKRLLSKTPSSCSFRIADRDEGGARALSEIKDQGINPVANAVAQSADHILGFFTMLRLELAFYVGCLNLYEALSLKGQPVCMPDPEQEDDRVHAFQGLYDASLALMMESTVFGSDVEARGKELVFITGANQGGKSTFLRSVGLAQLLMQCGMFVPARSFRANIARGLFTHYVRKEDASMNSGKFDEELGRMSQIVDHLEKNSLMLFNESFAATNEREGSEIARQIVAALLNKRVKAFYVTHMYELARGFYDRNTDGAIFLRAGRNYDGTRTYRMEEGGPLQTSFGRDLYDRIFAEGPRVRALSA